MNDLVSVIIPTFNRYKLTKRAILSILHQTYKNFEIIVVDDGSNDDSAKLKDEFDISYIYQENSGVSSARNRGIKAARGEWIAFLDSDDKWNEDKLQKQMEFFKKNPSIKFCHTKERWIREGREVKYPKRLQKPSGWCFYDNLQTCKIAPSSVMLHKSILNDVGLFDENKKVCEDYDMWLRVSKKYEMGLVKEKLITKYAGDDQLSKSITFIDLHHIYSLIRFKEDKIVKDVIRKKLNILQKGAKKHNNKELLRIIKMIKLRNDLL